jgi:hypothetical protein
MVRAPSLGVLALSLLLAAHTAVPDPLKAQAADVVASKGTAVALAGPGAVPGADDPRFRNSKLPLSWIMIVDSSLGLLPEALAGGRPDIKSGFPALKLEVKYRALRDVAAVEVTFVTFNIWNRFTGTFKAGRVLEVKTRQTKGLKLFWFGMEREDLNLYQTSILYVSRIRFADGTVIVADRSLVLEMARRVEASFTEQDLDKTKISDKDSADSET